MTLSEKVYMELKKDIFDCKFMPSMFISEKEIATSYGVSKGTASEALHRLCLDGHLVSYPRKGYRINVLSTEEHRQIQRLRIALESLVVEVIVKEVNPEEVKKLYPILTQEILPGDVYVSKNTKFHMELAKLTKDSFIVDTLQHLLGSLTRTAVFFKKSEEYSDQEYHKGILDAIIAGEIETAKERITQDLVRK